MTRSLRIALCIALVAGSVAALAAPAGANSYTVRDSRDIRNSSALDIISTRVGHKGDRLLHAVTLERSVTPQGLKEIGGFIDFLVSTDGDFKDFERRVYVLGGSRFRVFVTNGSGRKLLGRGKAYHPKPHTLGAVISPNVLGGPDGYHWFAVGVTDGPGDCCVDVAPKYWYIHDLTPPVLGDVTFGDDTSTAVPSTNVPISWSATDTGFGGLSFWTVRQRPDGSAAWLDVERGKFGFDPRTFDASETVPFDATGGATYEACVSLYDWADNAATSGAYGFSVPFDDTDAAVFQYSGADWTTGGTSVDFDGTLHTTSVENAAVTITVPAGLQRSLVVPGGYDGTASVVVNGGAPTSIDLSTVPAGQDRALVPLTAAGFHDPGGAPDVIVLTRTGGTLAVDGYLGAPAYTGSAAYLGCGGPPTLPVITSMARAAAVAPLSTGVVSDTSGPAVSRRG